MGTIVLHRLANVEGSAVSLTSLQAPRKARRAYERAQQDLRKGNQAEAINELQKAVAIDPNYATAWYELGQAQERMGGEVLAHDSYSRAIAADAKFVKPYLAIAELAASSHNWAELSSVTDRLLKLDAVDYPIAYVYSATANLDLGRLDAAADSARAGLKLDTPHSYPKLEQLLAAALARKRDYAGAAEHLRNYLALAPDAGDAARLKKDLRELERRVGTNQQAKAGTGGS